MNREFIFIHGYTGSADDFGELPKILGDEFGAEIFCPLLPGHGTRVEDLYQLPLEKLFAPIEERIKEDIAKGKKITLVGLSLGAQAALAFASKYAEIAGVIAIATTHRLMFPLNLPGLGYAAPMKRKWRKRFTAAERELRKDSVYYNEMPSNAHTHSRKLRALTEKRAANIHCPLLFIHSSHDRLGDPKVLAKLSRKIPGKVSFRFLDNGTHSLFYSEVKEEAAQEVVSFIKHLLLSEERGDSPSSEKASAIVPAYNEADRIGAVLEALIEAPSIDEIIAIDDGSSDGTAERAGEFQNVTVLRNEKNIGKAESMEKGVSRAKNDAIFFCDADLIGFRADHVEAILAPVLRGKYEMSIGIRQNFMQRTVRAWAENSGERVLRKRIWNELPPYYKHRYRIEAGLNNYVKHHTQRGLYSKMYDYSQPAKESKYGIFTGTILRWWMNLDVFAVYMRNFLSRR